MTDKANLTKRILSGMAIGVIIGLATGWLPAGSIRDQWLIGGLFQLIGGLFLQSIRMLVVPLVFVSLVCGAAALGDLSRLGRVGVRTLVFYLITTALAVSLALGISLLIQPGSGLRLEDVKTSGEIQTAAREPLIQHLLDLVPTNPVTALAEGKMLQVIFFALFTGLAAVAAGEKSRRFLEIFESTNEVLMSMVDLLMVLAPYGVAALIARTFADVGLDAVKPLMLFAFTVLAGLLLHMLLVYMTALRVIGRLKPGQFFRNFAPAMTVGFSTATSSGTLPVSMETLEARCGVSRKISSFTMPLGATINMDGTAIMQGVAVVFIAGVFQIPLSVQALITVVLTATLASVGTAGVPGVGLITLTMVLESVGLPVAGIALIIGVDRILDMARTAVNITGDAVVTILVAQSEGEFNQQIFDAENAAV